MTELYNILVENKYLILFIFLTLMFAYFWINISIKYVKNTDALENMHEIFLSFFDTTKILNQRLNDIDSRGTFESDDEVGMFFKELRNISDLVIPFTVPTSPEADIRRVP